MKIWPFDPFAQEKGGLAIEYRDLEAGLEPVRKIREAVGREMEIMVDGASKRDPRELSGRTRCNRVVNFDGQGKVGVGDVVHVCITQAMPHSLRGALVGEGAHVC